MLIHLLQVTADEILGSDQGSEVCTEQDLLQSPHYGNLKCIGDLLVPVSTTVRRPTAGWSRCTS